MAGVNLLPNEDKQLEKWRETQQKIYTITTAVLAVYVVMLAAGFGWWVYLNGRQEKTSSEVLDLREKIKAKSSTEAVVRLVGERAKIVNQEVIGRLSVSEMMNKTLMGVTEGLNILGWSFASTESQTLRVSAANAATIEAYAKALGVNYQRVKIDMLSKRSTGEWEGTITIAMDGGAKK